MRRHVGDPQIVHDQHHGVIVDVCQAGKDFGVSGVGDAAQVERSLVNRPRGDRIDLSLKRHLDRPLDVLVRSLAHVGRDRAKCELVRMAIVEVYDVYNRLAAWVRVGMIAGERLKTDLESKELPHVFEHRSRPDNDRKTPRHERWVNRSL